MKKVETVATRPQLARMHAIVARIQKGDYPSRIDLAREFECTIRTIQRDITFMKDQKGVPIEVDVNRRGYYLTQKLVNFPLLHISEGEIVALFVAQKALAQYRDTPFEQPLRAACEKLASTLKGEFSMTWGDLDAAISFRNFESNPVDISIFTNLSFARQHCREVVFEYCKLDSKVFESRRFRPYHLTCVSHQWYVLGYDHLRKEVRRFKLARMQGLRVLNSTFVRPKNFSADKFLKGSFGVFSGDKPMEICIWFDSFGARLIQERNWHHSQRICQLANGEIELRLTLTSTVEIAAWVMSWGTHAKVLGPAEFIKTVSQTLRAAAESYSARTEI